MIEGKTLKAGASITMRQDLRCGETTRKMYVLKPPLPELHNIFAHGNCICNQYVSAIGRVLGEVPECDAEGVAWLRRVAGTVCRRLPRDVEPMAYRAFVETYSGMRRLRYEKAVKSLEEDGPVTVRDSYVEAFCKFEKLPIEAKKSPDPRMIQARQPRYGAALGIYTKPIEHTLYHMLRSPRGHRQIGKGLDSVARAELLVAKMSEFGDPLVLSIDASRFDKHVGKSALRVEHSVYCHMCRDPELRRLLNMQLVNKCRSRQGIRYLCPGGRMSGDMNTALGNCLLMYLYTVAALTQCGYSDREYELLVDGDDTLIILSEVRSAQLAGLSEKFYKMGQEIKLENRATQIEQVVWCQSRPVKTELGWRFVRDWRNVLSRTTAGGHHWLYNNLRADMCHTIGICYQAEMSGVPILSAYAQKLTSLGTKMLKDWETMGVAMKYNLERKLDRASVNDEARYSFYQAFGTLPAYQRELERWILEDWSPDLTPSPNIGDIIGHDWTFCGPVEWTESSGV